MNAEVRAGSDSFLRLINRINLQTSADFSAEDDGALDDVDLRNYPALVALVEASLRDSFVDATPQHRQGFLRAIADLLAMHVDGAVPGDDWDPLKSSEAAFMAPSWAIAAIASAQEKPMPNCRD